MRLVVIVAVLLTAVTDASAHGPCGCLRPNAGRPGTEVKIAGPRAYRVVWNEPADRLDPLYARYDRPRERVVRLFDAKVARKGVRFHVPDVRPGRYAVKIYDGTEGGQHYTWALFAVAEPPSGRRYWLFVAAVLSAVAFAYGARRSIIQTRSWKR